MNCLIDEVIGVEHEYLRHMSRMDENGLRDLMNSYGQSVWDYAFVLTKSPHLADDISQDVFLKAFQRISTFRGESSVKTWLLAITRHTVFNYRKSAFFRKVLLVGFRPDRQASQSAEKEYLSHAYAHDLWALVLALPTKYREVLVLEVKYGLSMQEMASLLGISEGTAKSRLHRARKKVSDALKEGEGYETI
ncbi:RNA polymerase sigma factor [Paenibacillus aurantius]|uniref:RNA polymerase sigma factor n=1 Tax=Paenibacillus aurantius TaxID=2918900 RepID=A0AA96LHT5_9BACL|nr:RNA polymerase sigma factor [Paenibacillus aurantius]WNQ14061.1 RNA polymerase sigma factor [Paenibacillus aurantius]